MKLSGAEGVNNVSNLNRACLYMTDGVNIGAIYAIRLKAKSCAAKTSHVVFIEVFVCARRNLESSGLFSTIGGDFCDGYT